MWGVRRGIPLSSQLGSLGERRQLPQLGPERSPGRKRISDVLSIAERLWLKESQVFHETFIMVYTRARTVTGRHLAKIGGSEWGGVIPLSSRLGSLANRCELSQRGSGQSPDRFSGILSIAERLWFKKIRYFVRHVSRNIYHSLHQSTDRYWTSTG